MKNLRIGEIKHTPYKVSKQPVLKSLSSHSKHRVLSSGFSTLHQERFSIDRYSLISFLPLRKMLTFEATVVLLYCPFFSTRPLVSSSTLPQMFIISQNLSHVQKLFKWITGTFLIKLKHTFETWFFPLHIHFFESILLCNLAPTWICSRLY